MVSTDMDGHNNQDLSTKIQGKQHFPLLGKLY
jgi:hypothetical protein